MEELLPLIIGILWLVYTFYTKGQKKKSGSRSTPGEDPTSKPPSFLEKLLAGEGFLTEPEDDPTLYIDEEELSFAEKVEAARNSKEKPFLRTELSGFTGEGQSQFSKAYVDDQKAMAEIYDIPLEGNEIMEEFDLRKAVVFSAILDAPYIDYK